MVIQELGPLPPKYRPKPKPVFTGKNRLVTAYEMDLAAWIKEKPAFDLQRSLKMKERKRRSGQAEDRTGRDQTGRDQDRTGRVQPGRKHPSRKDKEGLALIARALPAVQVVDKAAVEIGRKG